MDQSSSINNVPSLHHVGYVVESIKTIAGDFAKSLALSWDELIFFDPLQAVNVSFFRSPRRGEPMIELVEPAGAESPVYKFLQRGGGLHHLCYEVVSLETQLELTRAKRDLIVREPLPAVAFAGRRIAWVYTRSKVLLEYLERQT